MARVAAGLALSVLAGVCFAGVLFPIIGTAGLIGKRGADDFLALPSKLETPASMHSASADATRAMAGDELLMPEA